MKLSRAEISILVFGAAFLVVLVAFFRPAHRVRREAPKPIEGVPAEGQATTVLSGFDYTESVGEKPIFRIRADRTVGYGEGAGLPPNRYALEKVSLTIYPEDGDPVTVQAERAQYDDRTKAAILEGNVRWVEPKDNAIGETERIEFDPTKRILRAPTPLHFVRGTFDVRASGGTYDVRSRLLKLTGPIQGSGTGQGSGGLSSLSADSGEYRRSEGIMELAGRMSATSAKGDRVSADRLLVKFAPEEARTEWARAHGSVRGTIAAHSSGGGERAYAADEGILYFDAAGGVRSMSLGGSPASVTEPKREISARSIDLDFTAGRPVAARAAGSVHLRSDQGNAESQRATASFGPTGGFQTLELDGEARFEGEGRTGLAHRVVDFSDRGVWVLTGNGQKAATVEEQGSKVSADRIEIDRNRKNLRAEGRGRAVFIPKKDRSADAASFLGDPSKPTYGKADRIVLDRETGVASLSGEASLWQDTSSLFADDITLNDAEKTAVAVGKVRAVLAPSAVSGAQPAKGKDEGPAIVTSRRLIYREGEATAVFEDGVTVNRGAWRASGTRGVVFFGKDRKVDRIELSGEVALEDRATGRTARADRVEDFPREGRTVLHGSPARVTDAGGNLVAGSTLTITGRGRNVEITAPEGGRTETIHKTKAD